MKQEKETISYLGPNTAIEGEIHSNGDLHLDMVSFLAMWFVMGTLSLVMKARFWFN